MSDYTKPSALREGNYGIRVTKADSILSADDDLFDVVGPCLITLMFGIVTAITDAGATTVAINEKASSIAIAAATTLGTSTLGEVLVVTGQVGAKLGGGDTVTKVVGMAGGQHTTGTALGNSVSPWFFNGGSGLIIECSQTGVDTTGQIDWTILYIPLAANSVITAAA